MATRRLACVLLAGLVLASAGPAAPAQPAAGAAVRAATPEEVERQIQDEERAVAAEAPVPGLSRRLSHYLRTRLPDLAVLIAATPGPSPYVCAGDFDGNGLEDTAVVVRNRKTQRLALMAFHQITEIHNPGGVTRTDYRTYPVHEFPEGARPDRLAITCNKPMSAEAVAGNVGYPFRNSTISLGFYVYYFAGDIYQFVLAGD